MKYDNTARKTQSDKNKQKITECGIKLINEKGFDKVSVSEITAAAGVSKGAFYIHFKSKEDLIERQIRQFYDDLKLNEDKTKDVRLRHFLINSLRHIKESGLKMAQGWFSNSVRGSFYGKSKLDYDLKAVNEIVRDEKKAEEIVSVYYGALNLWCFTDGQIDPEEIVSGYLKNIFQ